MAFAVSSACHTRCLRPARGSPLSQPLGGGWSLVLLLIRIRNERKKKQKTPGGGG